jgi:Domain of unknown function (DUF4760)
LLDVLPFLALGGITPVFQTNSNQPHWSVFIAPAIASVAAFVAWRAFRGARLIAKQKATLDLIEKRESTEHYRQIIDRFSTLRKNRGFDHLNAPTQDDVPDRRMLIDYLNHYELVSIGIRQDILDSKIYRAWIEGSFVRDWNAVADWVQRERWKQDDNDAWHYRASIYANYQHIACLWSPEAVRLTQDSSPPPASASGAGDDPFPAPTDTVELKT